MNTNSAAPCVGVRRLIWISLAILLAAASGCVSNKTPSESGNFTASGSTGPPAPTALKPGDDPAYDWEAPGNPQATDSPSWSYAINPKFANSRTLKQTTPWLKWAMETYGQKQEIPDSYQISDVTFSDCTMQWDAKRFMNHGDNVNETIYTLNLADIDIAYGALQANGATVNFSYGGLSNPKFQLLEKFWEKDGSTMKSRGDRTSADSSVVIIVQEKDDISRRIGWAVVHAVRLCGGKPSR
jgi:hypothetical protein